MDSSWVPLAVGLSTAAGAAGYFTWSLTVRSAPDSEPDPEWFHHFTPTRYRPMQRMLTEDDARWLAAQGMEPAAIRRLRAERRKIFSLYLDNMARDFEWLHSAARTLLMESQVDRPELTNQLISLRWAFQRNLYKARFSLKMHALGIGTVDVSFLVRAIESVHVGWQELSDASQFSPAASGAH